MIKIVKPAFVAGVLLVFGMLPATNNSSPSANWRTPPPLTVRGGGEGGGVIVEAKSALVFDLLTDKIIFQKNIYEPLPLASLSKIISSLVVAENIPLDEYIIISKSAVETEEPSTLRVGEHIRAEDLLTMAMGESSNDAMTALVEHLGDEKWFLGLMREKANQLISKSVNQPLTIVFRNPTGLDIKIDSLTNQLTDSPIASNYASAYDLAQIIKNSLDSIIWQVGNKEEIISKERIVHKIKHTNILRKELNGIYGAKTGFTDLAGGNLILIIERPIGSPKAIIILGSTLEGRFEDAKKILNF